MRKWLAAIVILVLLGIAAIAAGLGILWWQHTRPVTLPAPSGPYPVGRMDLDWRDPARVDPFAPAAGTMRELTVWIWYPAAPGSGSGPAEYLPAPLRGAMDQHTGAVMRVLLTHDLAKVHGHAIRDAAMSNGERTYPVVLFKPGIGALALDYTALAEDLASHGYVVVASDSPYSTGVVVYQDGRVVTRNRTGHPVDEGLPAPPREVIENVLRVWVADDRFILDQMQRLNVAGPFAGRLDLQSVGAYGHSFGGATALQFCADDSRCRASIDIDGIPFGDVTRTSAVEKPMLLFLSDHRNDRGPEDVAARATIASLRQRIPNHPNEVVLLGSRHFNLSDMAFTKNSHVGRAVGFLGPIGERRALAVTADFVHAFFDARLKGKPDLLPALAGRYPEIRIVTARQVAGTAD